MKQSDVFYVSLKEGGKKTQSKNGPSTDNGSVNNDNNSPPQTKEESVTGVNKSNGACKLELHGDKRFRLFELYFYKIRLSYLYTQIEDGFLMERDFLCKGFFELYVKELLANQLAGQRVAVHEINSKLSSFEGLYYKAVF